MRKLQIQDVQDTDVPLLSEEDLKTSYFEFWPSWLFYFPMKLYGLYLGGRYGLTVPTVSNPLFDAGGFAGESKSQILDLVPEKAKHWFAKHRKIVIEGEAEKDFQNITWARQLLNLSYPFVIKPDIGSRGVGVQVAESDADIKTYLQGFPIGEAVQIQELFDYPYEAGVFYIRLPHEEKGHIFSLTLKYFPKLIGDGQSTIKELIEQDKRAGKIASIYFERHKERLNHILSKGETMRLAFSGSHSRGTIFKNGNHLITDAMTDKIDQISKSIPEFYFGRYDIRLHRLSDLEAGTNMKIIEINGATAEATHIWDSNTTLLHAYSVLMHQYRMMFVIGAANKKRGFMPLDLSEIMTRVQQDKQRFKQYPITH